MKTGATELCGDDRVERAEITDDRLTGMIEADVRVAIRVAMRASASASTYSPTEETAVVPTLLHETRISQGQGFSPPETTAPSHC